MSGFINTMFSPHDSQGDQKEFEPLTGPPSDLCFKNYLHKYILKSILSNFHLNSS
jgi:hypothetical protein